MYTRFCKYAIALILGLLALIICVFKMNESFRMVDDSAAYISQAIAIAQGTTGKFIADSALMIGKYDLEYMTPTTYPWGFPLILSPIYKIFGFNIFAFKSVGIVCYAIFVGIFYLFCVRRLTKTYAIFATLLFALNPYMTNFAANEIYSDIPFLLVSFVALIILGKLFANSTHYGKIAESSSKSTKIGLFIATFGGIFMLFASLTRINGFVILCALIVMQSILIIKHFAPQIFCVKFLSPFARINSPYSWRIHAIPHIIFIIGFTGISFVLSSGSGRHLEYLTLITPQSILRNLSLIKFDWLIPLGTNFDILLFVICAIFILLGIYAKIYKNAESAQNIFYIIFILGFFVLIALWVEFEKRFLFLSAPFLVFWCFCGIEFIDKVILNRAVAVFIIFILLNLVWINVRDISFIKSDTSPDSAYSAESRQIYNFIIANTSENAIIISFKPRIFYLNTARLGFVSPKIERLSEADFVVWNGRYVNDLHTMQDILSPKFREKTELIFQNSEYKLFKIIK